MAAICANCGCDGAIDFLRKRGLVGRFVSGAIDTPSKTLENIEWENLESAFDGAIKHVSHVYLSEMEKAIRDKSAH